MNDVVCIIIAALFSYLVYRKRELLRVTPLKETYDDKPSVFYDELGKWPLVREISPCFYWIYAPHYTPSIGEYGGLGWRRAIGFAFLTLIVFPFSVIASIGLAIAAILIMWQWPWKQEQAEFQVFLTEEWMIWGDPYGRTCKVSPDFKMRVQVPHRRAAQESREYAVLIQEQTIAREEAIRRHGEKTAEYEQNKRTGKNQQLIDTKPVAIIPPAPTNQPPVYGIASELLVITGYGDRTVQTLAEFGYDEDGSTAHSLLQAIYYIREQCLKEARSRAESQPIAPDAAAPVESFE